MPRLLVEMSLGIRLEDGGMSAVTVVGALKETPKGRLSYASSPLDSCHSSTERLVREKYYYYRG